MASSGYLAFVALLGMYTGCLREAVASMAAPASQHSREHGPPYLTIERVHRKLIEQNVTGKSPGRLRIGRQTDDPATSGLALDIRPTTGRNVTAECHFAP